MAGVKLVNEQSILLNKLTALLITYLLIQVQYLMMKVVEIVDIESEDDYDDGEKETAV